MAQTLTPNAQLAAVIAEAGLTHDQLARLIARVASESDATRAYASTKRSHVSHWVRGTRPSGLAPALLCEALSRHTGRHVTVEDVGLGDAQEAVQAEPSWDSDSLDALANLGRAAVNPDRRRVLGAVAYSAMALAVPDGQWWQRIAEQGTRRASAGHGAVGRGDLEAMRDMVALFSRADQRHGGGHARTAVVQYLTSDVLGYLRGRFTNDGLRRQVYSTASELAYLVGWMAFDNGEHPLAQRYFNVAVKLAAEAGDPPMAGHVLRAMAHQAIDLGHPGQARQLAEASMTGPRYAQASARERALLGVVYGRALAAAGERRQAAAALLRAETDLAAADPGADEPSRVFFFGEASLAHETACALRDTGDLAGAAKQFRRSVHTRKAATFTRTHAVTLGYLGAVQARQGAVEDACGTWSTALEMMDGIRSGRTRQVARDIRTVLSPFRKRGIAAAADVDSRAAAYLAAAR